jgi:hypothetical protein
LTLAVIDRTGEDQRALGLFERHCLARDAGLVKIRMAIKHDAVYRDAAARADENGTADPQFIRLNVANRSLAPHRDCARQKVQKLSDRAQAPGHGHAFKHFGD